MELNVLALKAFSGLTFLGILILIVSLSNAKINNPKKRIMVNIVLIFLGLVMFAFAWDILKDLKK